MKKIILAIFGVTGILIFGSCSEDFLNTEPTSATATSTVLSTTDNAKLAVNGLAKLMTRQWATTQGYNGEGTVKLYCGEYPGDGLYTAATGWTNSMTLKNYASNTALSTYYMWAYYYMIISNANSIIVNIDDASGYEHEKQYLKAQALSYRAYCYLMLSQLYCKRWVDSSNGASNGLVLRLDPGQDNHLPLSTLGEVYTQIYEDLNTAISLFNESGYKRGNDEFYEIDVNVARAIYARAAITRQDYSTAASMAAAARSGYALMSVSDYKSGFSTANSEWIWGSFNATDQTLHFYGFFAYVGYNSTASAVRTYPKCISKELYDKIPDTDIRKDLFAEPLDASEYTTSSGEARSGSELITRVRGMYPDLQSDAKVFAYMNFKFKATDMPGVGCLNHIRSSEMILIEAEARYFLNNAAAAQSLMNELVKDSGRDPQYNCDKTGSDLLSEIKLYRKIELWGEGFSWFDLKRWNDPLIRNDFAGGGSYSTTLAVTVQPGENFNWTFYIPYREIAYNDAIDESVNQ